MKEFLVFLLTLFVIFISIKEIYNKDEIRQVKSNKDGITYIVRDLPDYQKAVELLSTINSNILTLIKSLDNKDNDDIDRLKNNYNANNLSETGKNAKYTSYYVNKGEKISICLRNKHNNQFEDLNTIMFVTIHELAHVMTESVGHEPEFWNNMSYLLHEAEKLGIYTHKEYSKVPVNYCGMEINSTPYDLKK